MIRATLYDKNTVIDILETSFADNQSINFIVKQDAKRPVRIRRLMEYCFDACLAFGDIFLSEDKKGCALIIYPHKKKTTLKTVLADIKLVLTVTGVSNAKKVMAREAKINQIHPKQPFSYLWYIGVAPTDANKGIGTSLLKDVLAENKRNNLEVYLETSVLRNIPWYQKFGFTLYHELNLGYRLFFLKTG